MVYVEDYKVSESIQLWQVLDLMSSDELIFIHSIHFQFHQHARRQNHRPIEIKVNEDYMDYINNINNTRDLPVPKETMELFAVMCIETSHYVTFVKCGFGDNVQWVFFDSMADRMGEFTTSIKMFNQ